MERVLLKLSGEAFGGETKIGINPDVMLKFANSIKNANDLKLKEIGIVVGGGNFFRGRDAEKIGIERVDCDYMGMTGTILNAIALKNALESIGCKAKVLTLLEMPQALEKYTSESANKYLSEGYVCIFAGGTGKPYFSTDTASLMRAVDIKAKTILMAKHGVDGVYDKDPNLYNDAMKYDILTHKELLEKKLGVMDLDAAKIANDNDIDILVFDMDKQNSIEDAVRGEKIGTIITKEK